MNVPVIVGSSVLIGTLIFGSIKRGNLLKAADSLNADIRSFDLHKIDLETRRIDVKVDLVFENQTPTPIKLSNLIIRINIADQKGTLRTIAISRQTGKFSIMPGMTNLPLRLSAPMVVELTNLIPTLLKGNRQEFVVEAFPEIAGRKLPPVTQNITLDPQQLTTSFLLSKLGLGLTNSSKKTTKSGKEYDALFPIHALKGTDPIVSSGSTFQTLREMEKVVKNTLPQTEKLAQKLKKGTLEQTLKSVFDFANEFFSYRLDEPGVEQIRTPARSWKDRFEGIDCDCFSVLISSILSNLGIQHSYRKAKYNGSKAYSHVYVVVPKQDWRP